MIFSPLEMISCSSYRGESVDIFLKSRGDFNFLKFSSTKNVLKHEGFALKEKKKFMGSKILWVRDEKEFYSLIEERLEKQGYEVFETSQLLSRDSGSIRFF